MPDPLLSLRLLLLVFAGFVNREQARAIDFLREENRVLRELLDARVRLDDGQRRRLAAKGALLGRTVLQSLATIVTPDTILRWHRQLVAAKFTNAAKKRVGRPGLMKTIREQIVRMARGYARWGYARIQGELKKLGHTVARSTIAGTLKDAGIPPSSDPPTSWRTFLKAHARTIAAMDFFATEVWTPRGLVTHYVLFVIHHASRLVEIAGVTANPDADFMAQVARNLTDEIDGGLRGRRFLILDRDTKFTAQFRRILEESAVEVAQTAFLAPNMNAIAERFVQTVKRECLERLILFGADHLQRALKEFVAHYHIERPHQGLGNKVFTASAAEQLKNGDVVVDERLGGLLRSYRHTA